VVLVTEGNPSPPLTKRNAHALVGSHPGKLQKLTSDGFPAPGLSSPDVSALAVPCEPAFSPSQCEASASMCVTKRCGFLTIDGHCGNHNCVKKELRRNKCKLAFVGRAIFVNEYRIPGDLN
jgi:hypothetical protein